MDGSRAPLNLAHVAKMRYDNKTYVFHGVTMRYGYKTYISDCPFCGCTNVIRDRSARDEPAGAEPEKTCPHYQLVLQGHRSPEMIFQHETSQKAGT